MMPRVNVRMDTHDAIMSRGLLAPLTHLAPLPGRDAMTSATPHVHGTRQSPRTDTRSIVFKVALFLSMRARALIRGPRGPSAGHHAYALRASNDIKGAKGAKKANRGSRGPACVSDLGVPGVWPPWIARAQCSPVLGARRRAPLPHHVRACQRWQDGKTQHLCEAVQLLARCHLEWHVARTPGSEGGRQCQKAPAVNFACPPP
jgi:hypothetical protein